jgi:hypothetical protein
MGQFATQHLSLRRAGATACALLALVAALPLGHGPVQAAPGAGRAQARPHLRFDNHPLYLRNGTLAGRLSSSDDDNNADASPTLSALCQSFLGAPNPYANPAPNVDLITGDTTVAAGSQTGCQSAQNETTIAVNPNNPNNLVAGTNDYRVFNTREGRNDASGWAYSTFDGGATWTNVQLPHLTFQTGATGALSDMDSAGDPSIAFGPNNTVYYANLIFSRLNDASGVAVSISHDGGLTWGEPVVVHTDGVDANGTALPTNLLNDKDWIAADPSSGKVYLTWTRFTYNDAGQYLESPIVISVSDDFGATWSAPRAVSPTAATFAGPGIAPYSQGSYPQVGRNGEVYVAYESSVCQTLACDHPTDHDAIVVAKSTNGGQSFSNTEVSVDYDFPYNADVGDNTLTGEHFRINSYPSFAVDRQTGRLYVSWADDRNGQYAANGTSIKTNGDVFVATSSNGTQWTQGYQIGTSADEVFPAIAAFNARVVVSFYTRAYDPTGIGLDYADVTATGLGNLQHTTVTRITTQTENPQVQFISIGAVSGQVLQGVFIGDYTAVALGSDLKAHPCWTDFRGNPGINTPNQDAYTEAIPLP